MGTTSRHPTKSRRRLEGLRMASMAKVRLKKGEQAKGAKRIARDGWLSPLELSERGRPGPQSSRSGVRASDKGFLSLSVKDYFKLLDWTGRHGREDKRGRIPASLGAILERIGIDSSMWSDLVWGCKRYFGRSRAAGRPENMQQDAAKYNHRWVQGQRTAAALFPRVTKIVTSHSSWRV